MNTHTSVSVHKNMPNMMYVHMIWIYGYGILFNVGQPLALGATILGVHEVLSMYIYTSTLSGLCV